MIADAAVVFVVSGDVGATAKHGGLYARFAEHLVELEAGMAAAQLGLQATALGLGATPVGAFEKKAVRSVVGSERVGRRPRSWSPSACRRGRTENTTAACD